MTDTEILLNALERIDQTLRIPAAEYVPAIGDVFTIIDETKAAIAGARKAEPDLLEACENFLYGRKDNRECEAEMRTAIAKAKGGTP